MSRQLTICTLFSALITVTAAMALRAADATLAVIAVAALAVLLAWYVQLHSTEDHSAAGLANPAWAVALAVVGRQRWGMLLPVIAAHLVGAVLGGLGALALEDTLDGTLIYAAPSLTVAAVGAAVVAVVGTWAALSIDGGGSESHAAIPVAVGGAVLPLGMLATFHPAAAVGLATAGLIPWDVALVAAGTVLAASAVGSFAVSLIVPAE